MKKLGDVLLTQEAFSEIVMGNSALVRAMIESGTRVITSYPGSPTPEIADAIRSIPQEKRPFYFEFSTNEKVATEVAYGAAINGHLSTVFFKSVGLNVASDTFVQLNHMNITGGMIVVLGDDPGANSSQNEQDNRHFARLSYTPVFEPASPSEVYQFYKAAAKLAREKGMAVILRLTTHVCHAKEKVCFDKWDMPASYDNTPRFDPKNGPYIPIASLVHPMKRNALKRLEAVREYSDTSELNLWMDNGNKKRGIITMGLPWLSLMEALEKADQKPDILKLGIVHPLSEKQVRAFLEVHEEVKLIEELDAILEHEIKAIAYDAGLSVKILGKSDLEDWVNEYTPDKVYDILRRTWPDMLPEKAPKPADVKVSARPPQMCPGCGHRSAFHAIRQALSDTDITVADIGCHTLGFLPPYEMGQLLMCMGASTGMGAGLSLYNDTRKVVTFMGDSTFFHAGLPGLINALFNNHKITMIIMENGTTAMTGHQDHAASGKNFNEATEAIPIRQLLEGLGVRHISEVDTYQQAKLTQMVKEAVETDEFSVVIARHPCMLKFMREQRKKTNFKRRNVMVDQEKCEKSYVCVENFGCPTFRRNQDGHIDINLDLCIGDGSCVQTCPTSAIRSAKTSQ